ncbi:hypothetical protein Hanom_Chr17g01562441 [Helianthus anomalus]
MFNKKTKKKQIDIIFPNFLTLKPQPPPPHPTPTSAKPTPPLYTFSPPLIILIY